MIDTPEIVLSQKRDIAVIPLEIARDEMQRAFGDAVKELMETLARQGISPSGALLARYFEITRDGFDFEVGVPVAENVETEGRVMASSLPEAKVARTVHHGDYEALPGAWEALGAWMEDRGLPRETGGWETYIVGPDATDEASEWKTELCWPIERVED